MEKKKTELLCIGNALIDIFANGEEGIDYGLTLPVQHIEMNELKKILSQLPRRVMVSGGSAVNVAKIAGHIGTKAAIIGAVGEEENDVLSRMIAYDLFFAETKPCLVEKPSPTGMCLMLRTGDKTQIVASPSAALELSADDIEEQDIKEAKVVVIDGYILDRPGLVQHILTLAEKHKTAAAIDLGSTAIAGKHAAEIAAYTEKYPLILFMNEEEAEAFYNALTYDKDLKEHYLVHFLRELRPSKASFACQRSVKDYYSSSVGNDCAEFPIIVVKLRERGAVCYAGGTVYPAGTEAITPLESTGAGDAFCAAFLTAWVRNKPISECAALGNKAAGITLNTMGTQTNDKSVKSLQELLE